MPSGGDVPPSPWPAMVVVDGLGASLQALRSNRSFWHALLPAPFTLCFRSHETPAAMTDFFISYTRADRDWAVWIAWVLEAAGFTTKVQAWDFPAGSNFIVEMHEAAAETERTIAVLSPEYLGSHFGQTEWAAALAQKKELVPIRVREVEVTGLLAGIIYTDLVGLAGEAARSELLAAASDAGHLVKLAHIVFQVGIVGDALLVALEDRKISHVEANQRREQPPVGLGDLPPCKVALPREPQLDLVERVFDIRSESGAGMDVIALESVSGEDGEDRFYLKVFGPL